LTEAANLTFRADINGADAMKFETFFRQKFIAKILAFLLKLPQLFLQNFDRNIGFREKRHFFCRKLAKIAKK
jgi:hypothetical protein